MLPGPAPHHKRTTTAATRRLCLWPQRPGVLLSSHTFLMSLQGLMLEMVLASLVAARLPAPGLAVASHPRLLPAPPMGHSRHVLQTAAPHVHELDARWAQGSMGVPAPAPAQVGQALRQRSLFLYLGHGAGEDLVRAKSLAKQAGPCAACILMGCSSGRLGSRDGALPRGYDAQGPALAYLLAGEAHAWQLGRCPVLQTCSAGSGRGHQNRASGGEGLCTAKSVHPARHQLEGHG